MHYQTVTLLEPNRARSATSCSTGKSSEVVGRLQKRLKWVKPYNNNPSSHTLFHSCVVTLLKNISMRLASLASNGSLAMFSERCRHDERFNASWSLFTETAFLKELADPSSTNHITSFLTLKPKFRCEGNIMGTMLKCSPQRPHHMCCTRCGTSWLLSVRDLASLMWRLW